MSAEMFWMVMRTNLLFLASLLIGWLAGQLL